MYVHGFKLYSWPTLLASLLSMLLLTPTDALTAEWRVTPLRLSFDRNVRSSAITITNESAENLHLSVNAVEWSQDSGGVDVYEETAEIIFFPKTLIIPSKQERVIRTGIRAPNGSNEKTYRLFLREVADPQKTGSTAVALTLQFGVPIFIKPVKEELRGEINQPRLSYDSIQAAIINTGNVHFRIYSVQFVGLNASGEQILAQEQNGWYLLAGATRTYTAPIAGEICSQLKAIEISAKTDRLTLNEKIDVDPAMCLNK